MSGGRPSLFTPELGEEVCTRLSEGETLVSICRDRTDLSVGLVNGWVLFPSKEAEAFSFPSAYARARQLQRAAWADIAAETVFTTEEGTKTVERVGGKFEGTETTTGDMVEHRKLKVNTLQWFLARLDRGNYGDQPTKVGAQDEVGTLKIKIINDPEA